MSLEEISVQMYDEDEEKSLNPEEPQEKAVKRRIRVGKKYHHIKNTIRKQLISRVESKGEKIIEVAKELGMKYSTAKSILKVYRAEGRTNKIPKSQRYLSLRIPDPDDFPAEKIPVNRRSKDALPVLEENLSGNYHGPSTRLRSSKKVSKETVVEKKIELKKEAVCKFEYQEEEYEASEPALRKKLVQEVIPKLEEQPVNLKTEASLQPENCFTKKEICSEASSSGMRDPTDAQGKTISNESSNGELKVTNAPRADSPSTLPEVMPRMRPMPSFNPLQMNPFGMDLARIRLQNMAMYLQTLRLQTLLLKSNNNSLSKKYAQ